MIKAFIIAALGIVVFSVCYSLVHPLGEQFIKNTPATEPVVTKGVLIISFLMTLVALRQIYGLFQSKRRNW
jgi:hypothetical protein